MIREFLTEYASTEAKARLGLWLSLVALALLFVAYRLATQ